MRRPTHSEMEAQAAVWTPAPQENDTIPATLWGTADDIEVTPRVLREGQEPELCVTFCAEGGYAGGRLRVSDLLDAVLKHHPHLVQQALDKARGEPRDAI